ncbi:hypothetical protein LPMP_252480 [Leishmania panamensis]|uniref:Uncharacterized protein n=1 Tax=Leishmania panamensis TaxID=5679 RepID=A0A088SBR1_LEIPA|nr:hypothetical protein LPMP_252480 [Leishmania panamensis]AIN99111.1 hypothetical protein LPMP_252480 [Leishmania panamensis]
MNAEQTKMAKKPKDGSWRNKFVEDAAVIYSKDTTNRLTDFAGAFLILCISVYFTTSGYLFYRELALSK